MKLLTAILVFTALAISASAQPVFDSKIIDTARREMSVYKMVGYESDRVRQYCESTDQEQDEYYGDGWCSGFVSWVLKQNGYQYASLNTGEEWIRFADIVTVPEIGDIVIIPGHIAFFAGYSSAFDGIQDTVKGIKLLGGNQGHRVCELPLSESYVTMYLRPRKAPFGWQPSRHYSDGAMRAYNRLDDHSYAMEILCKDVQIHQ